MPDRGSSGGRRERVALVLAGGGVRGAYEAGALATLAPALTADGRTLEIIIGTSIGALNGAFLAARSHEPLQEAATATVEMWRKLRWHDALRPLISRAELGRALGAAAMLTGLPGPGLPALLDPSPLRSTLKRLVSFEQIQRNIKDGTLTAAAVIATSYATTRSVVFHSGGPALVPDMARAIDYHQTRLAPQHVLASAAIPAAFPAVEIEQPATAAGWYSDGGLRLNTPLKPALSLGAQRMIVIGLNSSLTPVQRPSRPDALDGIAQLLQATLADQLAEDIATLATINETLTPTAPSATREDGTGPRRIPYIFIAPSNRLQIGRLARKIYNDHYATASALLRHTDPALLGRIVNAQRSAIHGELLSYLFLAPEFIDSLIALGRHDAEHWLTATHDTGLWQTGRLPA